MSKEEKNGPDAEALQTKEQAGVASPSEESEAIGELMQSESAAEQAAELGDRALAAAEDAVASGESAQSAQQAEESSSVEPNWILRGMLILNLALMGVMLALPNAQTGKDATTPIVDDESQQKSLTPDWAMPLEDPFVSPEPKQATIFGDEWNRASQLAGRGQFEEAALLLSQYIEGEGAREPSFVREQMYRNLSVYSFRLGELDQAAKYDSLAEALASQTKLPVQLFREAEEAEAMGDTRLMRQAYARLLLIQSQVSPTQFNKISEAYLKLADSFRLEAKRGEEMGK